SMVVAGAAARTRECGVALARRPATRRIHALHPRADVLRAGLRGTGAGDLAEPAAARSDDLEGRGAAVESGLRAGGHADHAARGAGLHVVVVLGVPRQGRRGRGLSLRLRPARMTDLYQSLIGRLTPPPPNSPFRTGCGRE